MSTLTYSHGDLPAADATRAAAAERPGFLRRIFDHIVTSQQRRAEREIAAYLKSHGGLFTDDMEREIGERLAGRKRTL
jgi:hypothetical protein